MNCTPDFDPDPVGRLTRDLRNAARTLSTDEARFLVDAYYAMQRDRIRAAHQERTLAAGDEPHDVMSWLAGQRETLENQVRRALDAYSGAQMAGMWARSIVGIGPVIAAGLLANIDIKRAPTVGHIWRFAGLDPTTKWSKGVKRPWNGSLKRLCCAPGTTITTRAGPKLIEHIVIGDEVLTHRGRWRRVTDTMQRDYDGDMVTLRAHGLAGNGPVVTPNHPVLVKQMRIHTWEDSDGRARFRANPRKRRVTQIDDARWSEVQHRIAAGERGAAIAEAVGISQSMVSKIRHGYERQPTVDAVAWARADAVSPGWRVLSPTPPIGSVKPHMVLDDLPSLHNPAKRRDAEVNGSLARLVGLYLGDGHTSVNRVVWSFGLHEGTLSNFVIDILRSTFGLVATECITHNMRIVTCGSQQLQRWFDTNTGKLAHGKCIPDGWMDADELVIIGLLRGLFESDGSTGDNGCSYASVNWKLAQSVAQMLRMLQIPATAVPGKVTAAFPGRDTMYTTHFYRVQPCDRTAFFDRIMDETSEPTISTAVAEWGDGGAWHTARDHVASNYTGPVFNLEVADDHSYVANGIAVHNCFLIGESFVKVSNKDNDVYGKIYKARKEYEQRKNEAGDYADQAVASLAAKKFGVDTEARKHYEAGRLPPARIQLRAERVAVKLFLAHLHHVMYEIEFGEPPPKPYILSECAHLAHPELAAHTKFAAPPNWPMK